MQGYVVLPMYFPNAAAISGDASEARVLCLSVEFQVVEQVAAGFLIGRDATKAYKVIIDEELGQIVFPTCSPAFYVPITEISREETQKMDARVFAVESVSILHLEEFKDSGDDIRRSSRDYVRRSKCSGQ